MRTHSLVYSNNRRYRLLRHLLFWLAWICYFMLIDGMSWNPGHIGFLSFTAYSFLQMVIVLSVDVVFCYAVLYQLIPKLLLKEKYLIFFLFLCLFLLLDAALSSYFYTWLINPLRGLFELKPLKYTAFTDLLRGLSGTLMLTGAGATIKLLKMWNIKAQELSLVKSEKIHWELKFIDTFIQPSFLPVLLKKIYSYSFSAANRVPEMLEKLQHIIAYLINECNQSAVLLSHEIDAIGNFIQLEKLTTPDHFSIQFDQTGDPATLSIVPYILFPLVEHNFRQIKDHITDKHWTSLSINAEGTRVVMQLRNSKPVETSNLMVYETATLQQIRKTIDLLYPGSYTFSIVIEENVFSIFLEIDLSKRINQ
jgi:hypothetical protein